MGFGGFDERAFDFYARLAANNSRTWWQQHRDEYETLVRAPLQALVDELEPEFGTAKLFRPYNDQRFHKGEPIKTHQGAVVSLEDAVGYYVQVSAEGLFTAGGWYSPGGKQLARFRDAVDGPAGAELERILAKARRTFVVDTNPLATRPRGVDADHPRLELMRSRKVVASRTYPIEPWLGTVKARDAVRRDWRAMRPLLEWLADHVGPFGEPGE